MKRPTKHHETEPRAPWRLWKHKGGNIALITALVMIPLTFALGMAFDYTQSRSRQDQLDGMADVAALGAVTPSMMAQSSTAAQTQALNLFYGQAATVPGVTSVSAVATPGGTSSGTTITRTMSVKYTAKSQNVFATLLGMPTLTIGGTSTSTGATAPNINFYLLLDTSPSMEIAATSAGITAMENATQQESNEGTPPNGGGCAFGCHQSNPADLTTAAPKPCVAHVDPAAKVTKPPTTTTACQFLTQTYQPIPCTTNGSYMDGTTFTTLSTFPETGRDNYDLSRCLHVTLRIDLLNTAAQNLMTTAAATELTYNSVYQMALYVTDSNQSSSASDFSLTPALQSMTSDLTAAKTAASKLTALGVYSNNYLTSSDDNDDTDTMLDADIDSMNGIMPPPGQGTNNVGDTPQEVLFIVTDGLNDEATTGSGNCPSGQKRICVPMDWNGTYCNEIKTRGIRIAVLYTTYEPVDESFYLGTVVPALPSGLPPGLPASTPVGSDPMALAAQQCASPGLFYQVSTDGDISTALSTLFQEAVTTARLSQ